MHCVGLYQKETESNKENEEPATLLSLLPYVQNFIAFGLCLQFLRKQPEAANLRNNKRPVYAAKYIRLRVGIIIFRGSDHVVVTVNKSLNMLCARRVL